MFCLGIESTAHTFACSVVQYSFYQNRLIGKILSDARDIYVPPIGSGIHPRDASRHHCKAVETVFKHALCSAKLSMRDIDVIAYSAGPGLGPCLRVGAVVARTLSAFHSKPLVPTNHGIGHVELGIMISQAKDPLVLLVSGGHTAILAFSGARWRIFGETLDITLGQLFDQFGRSLGLPSPCGHEIEQLGRKAAGNYRLLPYVVKGNDVSFSGLLTSAIRSVHNKSKELSLGEISFSLQETSFAMVTEAVERALSLTLKNEFLIVGGVAANNRLAEMLKEACKRQKCKFYRCPAELAGDNGAQIAWAGVLEYVGKGRDVQVEKAFINQSWRINEVDVIRN